LYIDYPVVDSLPLPNILKRALGSVVSACAILGSTDSSNEVLHVNTSLYPTTVLRDLPPVFAATIRGTPIFLQVHGGRLANLGSGSIPYFVWHWMCRRATCLGIYPGPQWRECQQAGYAEKMIRMYNLVPASNHTAPLSDRPAHFLFLGRVVRKKGVREALNSFLRLREEGYNDIQMTIAGEGSMVEELREQLSNSAHAEAVSIPGFLEREDLEKVRRCANIFVLPSRHQEGFPFSFLECAERGMACIVTENSAIPDVFERGKEFEAVDLSKPDALYEKMKRMVIDVDHRERIGRAGQAAVRSCCTIEAAADRFQELYTELTGRHPA